MPNALRPVPPASTFASPFRTGHRQGGSATVEFALVALVAFLPLLLGVIEAGRLFYLATTTQEVTRRAARAQVVRWVDQAAGIQRHALFRGTEGQDTLPGAPEIGADDVRLEFFESYADALNRTGSIVNTAMDANYLNCLKSESPCIRYVRASLLDAKGQTLRYRPVTGLLDRLFDLPLPGATVIMPAEALGLL